MANKVNAIVVLVTCKSAADARRIASALVRKRLAACGSIFGTPIASIYRWKGRIEHAKEALLILKSTRKSFPALEAEVRRLHSYKVPEIIALPVISGSQKYLTWIQENVG